LGALTYNTTHVGLNPINASVLIDPNYTSVPDIKNELEVYPNPASDFLTINTFSKGDKTISILDLAGRNLKIIQSSEPVIQIPLTDLANGDYEVVISFAARKTVSNFVVQH
jgi:hypothetical protein